MEMNSFFSAFDRRLQYFKFRGLKLLSPASDEALLEAEKILEFELSPQHKEFLKRYNGGRILEIHLFGVPLLGVRRLPVEFNIIESNTRFLSEEWWPKHWRRLANDGFGNYFVADLSRKNETGEYPILFVDHESLGGNFDDISSSDYAPDYFRFLERVLEEMIELYSSEGKLKEKKLRFRDLSCWIFLNSNIGKATKLISENITFFPSSPNKLTDEIGKPYSWLCGIECIE